MLIIVYNLIDNEHFCVERNHPRVILFIFMHEISYFDVWKSDIHALNFPVSISSCMILFEHRRMKVFDIWHRPLYCFLYWNIFAVV